MITMAPLHGAGCLALAMLDISLHPATFLYRNELPDMPVDGIKRETNDFYLGISSHPQGRNFLWSITGPSESLECLDEEFTIAVVDRPLPPIGRGERLRHQNAVAIGNEGKVASPACKVDLLGTSSDLHGHMEGAIPLLVCKLESCPDVLGGRGCRHIGLFADQAFDISASDDRLESMVSGIEWSRRTLCVRVEARLAAHLRDELSGLGRPQAPHAGDDAA